MRNVLGGMLPRAEARMERSIQSWQGQGSVENGFKKHGEKERQIGKHSPPQWET
jgi:hypothetical protein